MRAQIDALTGIRGYAALWVVLFHLRVLDIVKPLDFGAFVARGYWAVDLFFMLSGFILGYVYEAEFRNKPTWHTYKNYLWLRIGRLYPLHLVTFLGFLALVLVKQAAGMTISTPDQFDLKGAVASLLLVHSWGTVDRLVWNDASWSISAEFFAYLFLFPLYCWLFQKVSLWLMGILILLLWAGVYTIALPLQGSIDLTYNFGVLRIIPEFLAGYWLFKIRAAWQPPKIFITVLCITACGGMYALSQVSPTYEYLLLPLIFLLLASLSYGNSFINALFANRFSVYLGKISYSLYMTHLLVRVIADQALRYALPHPPESLAIPVLGGVIVIMLVVASLGYHLVEEPARHWVRKKFVTIPLKGT
jgi:peptidoglycan/LPS O-acetylase OafA/YrhL